MKKFITADLKILFPRFFIILVTLVLVAAAINIIANKISGSTREADTAKSEEADLGKKFNSLSQLQKSTLPTGSASLALPNENSSLLALAQLRKIAADNSIVFTDVQISPESSQSGIFHSNVTLDISAPFPSITIFIKKISEAAPIMRVDSVKLLAVKDISDATLIISAFWAPFPTQLPPVSKELQQPSTEENQTLTKLSTLSAPSVGVNLTPQSPSQRSDPFSLQ